MGDDDQPAQTPLEEHTHVFIVKFWWESNPGSRAFWRGHITHVSSNQRVYVQNAVEIGAYIEQYLELPETE